MLKLYLATATNDDFDYMLPDLLVARNVQEAREIYGKALVESGRIGVLDFDIDEVNEVGGCEIRVVNPVNPNSELAMRLFDNLEIIRFTCPVCEKVVEPVHKYCPECGTKIKWSDNGEQSNIV